MIKTYKVVLCIDGEMQTLTFSSKYALKKWARISGHALAGYNTSPNIQAELQNEAIYDGLIGPVYAGKDSSGVCVLRYADKANYNIEQ